MPFIMRKPQCYTILINYCGLTQEDAELVYNQHLEPIRDGLKRSEFLQYFLDGKLSIIVEVNGSIKSITNKGGKICTQKNRCVNGLKQLQ